MADKITGKKKNPEGESENLAHGDSEDAAQPAPETTRSLLEMETQDGGGGGQTSEKTNSTSDSQTSEVEKARLEAHEYRDKYLRAMADYRNLERRVQEERRELIPTIRRQVVEAFLPVLANLDTAEKFISDPGLKMIKDQFVQVLESLGVTELPLMGTEFDPQTAEAIEVVPGDEENKIVEVVRKAYVCNGKVIQHGQVKVSRKGT